MSLLSGMKNLEEKSCHCALNRIFGFKPKLGLALISHLGSASEAFRLKTEEIEGLLGPYSTFSRQIKPQAAEEAAEELIRLEEKDIRFVGWNEDDYPELLHECEDAPIGLYVKSRTPMHELWRPRKRIAVVGTRNLTPYGKEWCFRIVSDMAMTMEKPVIISGLALGTDICAHRTALESGLPTIAVMATGPDAVYPHRHMAFAETICNTPGCALITDYPPGTSPLALHFLRRNRIIAGLSDSVILVESKIKGGGMMTSRLAFSYNRDVYALPGRVDDTCSQGCNMLIRSKIAEPIVSTEALNCSLGLNSYGRHKKASHADIINGIYGKTQSQATVEQLLRLTELIGRERGISLDEITFRTGLEYGAVSHLTGLLVTEGLICIDILQRCSLEIGKLR